LLNWVELNHTPDQVNVSNIGQGGRDRPVWPHPALTVYNPATDSFVQGGPSTNSDQFQWLGLSHYTTSHTAWCTAEGSSKPSSSNANVNAQTSSWTMTCGVNQPTDD
jgi:hypothetical protein